MRTSYAKSAPKDLHSAWFLGEATVTTLMRQLQRIHTDGRYTYVNNASYSWHSNTAYCFRT